MRSSAAGRVLAAGTLSPVFFLEGEGAIFSFISLLLHNSQVCQGTA